jgi:hypothetical protein
VSTAGIVYLVVLGLLMLVGDITKINQIGNPRGPVTSKEAAYGVVASVILFAFAAWAVTA